MGDRGGSIVTGRDRADQAIGLCKKNPTVYDADCKGMLNKIRNRCEISDKDNNRFRGKRERLNARRKKGKKRQVRNMTWKDKHCGKMLLNLNGDALQDRLEKLSGQADEMMGDLQEIAMGAGWNLVAEAAAKYGGKVAARHALATGICGTGGAAAGSVVPVAGTAAGAGAGAIICNIGAAVLDIVSGLWTAWDTWSNISDIKELVADGYAKLEKATQTAERIREVIDDPTKIDQLKKDVMAEMVDAATNDPCLKARKCFLVPYSPSKQGRYGRGEKDLKGGSGKGLFDTGPMSLADSRGCCPGQTAHHLIQDSWLKTPGSKRGAGDRCAPKRYNVNKAPTVCVEGMNQRTGSHGTIHQTTEDRLQAHLDKSGGKFTMANAIDVAAKAHQDMVGKNTCNQACIKDQIRDYFEDMGCDPIPTDRDGNVMGPSTANSDSDDTFD